MCLGAVYWSGIRELWFGNSRRDAAEYGFKDDHIYDEIGLDIEKRSVRFNRILGPEAIEAFNLWDQKSDKILY
jgi:tRNA(Arg) A34 adenosine deaminase TadA